MSSLQAKQSHLAWLTVAAMVPAALLAILQMPQAARICCALSVLPLGMFCRHAWLLRAAALIEDNCILAVPDQDVVISTFGLRRGARVYRWGCNGVQGIRLLHVAIDREHIWLVFGDDICSESVRLPHGLTDEKSVGLTAGKFRQETGVRAEVSGW